MLNKKHEQFIDEYLKDFNGTQAYIRVYPNVSYNSAKVSACRLLENEEIKNEISKRQNELKIQHSNQIENVISDLFDVCNIDITNFVRVKNGNLIIKDTDELSENEKGVIQSIETTKNGLKITKLNKLSAIELLCKIFGLTNQTNLLVDTNGDNPILQGILEQITNNKTNNEKNKDFELEE